MKVCFGFSLCLIIFLLLSFLAVLAIVFIFFSIITAETITAISTMVSAVVAVIAACYARTKYEEHLKEEHTKLLCEYNQRYSNDCNIKIVIEWMLKVAVTNEKGDIVGVNLAISNYEPSINTKEMFMRFFEELYIQMDVGNLKKDEVHDLFAYYAIKFDNFKEYHNKVTDYTSYEEVQKLSDSEKNNVNANWKYFSKLIDAMIEFEKNNNEK